MMRRVSAAILACMTLAACGSPEPDRTSQDNSAAASQKTEPQAATQKTDPGETAFLKCRACHNLKAGEPNRLGPNLHGLFGAKAGQVEGYTYSAAMTGSEIIWDAKTLDVFLESPREIIPGTKMVFAGLADQDERDALIAYLEKETQ